MVIPARDAARTIGLQLEALSRQDFTGAWEVVIADNGSTDATVEVAESYRSVLPALLIVPATTSTGINHARNVGVRAARGQLLCFCDADDRVHPSWLRELVAALDRYDATGGTLDLAALNGPALTLANGRAGRRVDLPGEVDTNRGPAMVRAGALVPNGATHGALGSNLNSTPGRAPGDRSGRTATWPRRRLPTGGRAGRRPVRPSSLEFLPYPIGANCAVRREVWEATDGFDESFVLYGDEVDFFWRTQLAGYRFGRAPDAVVDYRLPTDLRGGVRRGFARGRASADLYRRFAPHGARFRPGYAVLGWLGLFARSYRIVAGPQERAAWLVRAAQHVGRLVGGLEQRRLYF